MSNRTTFTIKQGKTFTRRVEYWYGNPPTPFNMTEYQARMQVRPSFGSTTLYCDLSSSIGPDGSGLNMTPTSGSTVLPKSSGSIGINISAFSSSQFTWKEGFFDLEIYSGSGVSQVVHEILSGKILVLPEITKS